MTITDVATRGLASDVAVAVVTLDMGEFTTPEGELKAGTQDKLSLILVKRADGWRIGVTGLIGGTPSIVRHGGPLPAGFTDNQSGAGIEARNRSPQANHPTA
jgi:hypothetical protein